jgi:opacity protein-like surface antigen
MKTKILLSALFIISLKQLPAQSLRYSVAQPYISLSAYSVQQNEALSFTGNQAALATTKHTGIGVFGERRFMLKETSVYTLGAAVPTRLGNFGIQINYAGFKNFRENKIGLAYARKLGKLIDVGVQFNYYGYSIPTYGKASAINFEIGALFHLTDKLNAGIHVYNPVGGKLGKNSKEKLAAAYKVGLGYDASDKFFICSEIIKEEDKALNVIAGLQYQFAKQFFAKAGFRSESGSMYAGAGIGWKNLRLDIASSYHPQLGFSPGILLIMHFKSKAE